MKSADIHTDMTMHEVLAIADTVLLSRKGR